MRYTTMQAAVLGSIGLGVLGGLGAIATPISASASMQEYPETITLTGVVRDFREKGGQDGYPGHPDFENMPSAGAGVYAGNLEHFIGPGRKPVFTGAGNKVTSSATDALGRPIAPHLANHRFISTSGSAPNVTSVILSDSQGTEAYEIEWLSTTLNENGTSTWVYRVSEIPGGKDLSHWNLALSPGQTVAEGTTAGYEVGIDGSTGFYGIKWDVAESFSTGEFTIVLDGHYYGMDQSAAVLAKGGNAPDIGSIFAPTDMVSNTGSPFIEGDLLIEDEMGDTEATLGLSSNGGVTSGDSFFKWFRDYPEYNFTDRVEIELQHQGGGVYVFDSSTDPTYSELGGFFPIENDLFGNPGGTPDRNYHFTYEIHAEFTYDADGDQFFRFAGDDDVWVFIDGKLAIDLGGVHSPQEQYVDLERFGLTDGETYDLDFFFAERHRTGSDFRIETNLALESVDWVSISAKFD